MRYFFPQDTYHQDPVPQGLNEWINWPEVDGDLPGLFAARASIAPGMGHGFHYHPGREEIIYVLEGSIEQWVGEERRVLRAGDSVIIPADRVHASFNTGSTEARIFVVLTPAASDQPLAVDVAGEAPWKTLRKEIRNT